MFEPYQEDKLEHNAPVIAVSEWQEFNDLSFNDEAILQFQGPSRREMQTENPTRINLPGFQTLNRSVDET